MPRCLHILPIFQPPSVVSALFPLSFDGSDIVLDEISITCCVPLSVSVYDHCACFDLHLPNLLVCQISVWLEWRPKEVDYSIHTLLKLL